MENDYDVAVIGSGVGGICAAALLAHRGYRTLLAEGLDRWGGRLSTVEKEGFRLPTGAILLHRDGPLERVFKEVGVRFEVVNLPKTLHCRVKSTDHRITLGNPFTFINMMRSLGMPARESLRVGAALSWEIGKAGFLRAAEKVLKHYLPRGSRPTFREWLLKYTDNDTLHGIFDTVIVAVLACRAWELPASEFFAYMTGLGTLAEAGIAPQGNLELVRGLVRVVEKNGEAWLRSPVRRIVVSGGQARGIEVEREGKVFTVTSKVVISDSGPRRTVELAGAENFGMKYIRDMRVRLRAGPAVLVLVGSERPLLPEDAHFMIIAGARRIVCAGDVSILCPDLAPPGRHLSYYCGYPLNSLVPMETEWERAQCTRDLEENFPEIKTCGEVIHMGFHDVHSDFPGARAWPGYDMPAETPIKNLFNVGEGVRAPGWSGTNKAAKTAWEVAEMASRKLSRT